MTLNENLIDNLHVSDLNDELIKCDLSKYGKKQNLVEIDTKISIKRNLITYLKYPEKGCDVIIIWLNIFRTTGSVNKMPYRKRRETKHQPGRASCSQKQ